MLMAKRKSHEEKFIKYKRVKSRKEKRNNPKSDEECNYFDVFSSSNSGMFIEL